MTPEQIEEAKLEIEGHGYHLLAEYLKLALTEIERLHVQLDKCFGSGPSAYMELGAEIERLRAEVERLNTGPRIIHAKDCERGPMSSCTCAAGLGDGP